MSLNQKMYLTIWLYLLVNNKNHDIYFGEYQLLETDDSATI